MFELVRIAYLWMVFSLLSSNTVLTVQDDGSQSVFRNPEKYGKNKPGHNSEKQPTVTQLQISVDSRLLRKRQSQSKRSNVMASFGSETEIQHDEGNHFGERDLPNARHDETSNSSDDKYHIKPLVSSSAKQNISSLNMTALNNYSRSLRRQHDVTSATLCLSAVLILLVIAVLHSRMWQRREQWRTLDEVLSEQEARSELPEHGRITIRDLVDSKISMIKSQFRRIQNSRRHSQKKTWKKGSYKELFETDVSESGVIYSSR